MMDLRNLLSARRSMLGGGRSARNSGLVSTDDGTHIGIEVLNIQRQSEKMQGNEIF
jgi:hypothetical protein